MWLLESDGDLLAGKKLWLRPGVRCLFGRVKPELNSGDQHHIISHKSVSRKHLVVQVAPVTSGQGHEVYTRSKITITDDSKLGTIIDDDKVVKSSKTLSGKKHTVKLGSYEQTLKLTWHPITFTFNFTAKETRKNPHILEGLREKLEPLDVKIVNSYIIDATTHVVVEKRNTPKGLQALVNGRYIVTESFVDGVIQAAARLSSGDATPSPLELDFDAHWPDASKYLPGPGKEPHPRPSEDFVPRPERLTVFEGFTFTFLYAAQMESLSPALTNGGAKTLLYELKPGQSSLEEFIQYTRNVADKKGLADVHDPNLPKAVVIVRPPGGEEKMDGWTRDFFTQVDLELEQRSVWQNEFLDAILQVDARPLKRAIEMEPASSRPPPSTAPQPTRRASVPEPEKEVTPAKAAPMIKRPAKATDNAAEVDSQPVVSSQGTQSRAQGRIKRIVAKSRFKGFDDFDDDAAPPTPSKPAVSPVQEDDEGSAAASQPVTTRRNDSQSLFVSDSQSQSQQVPKEEPQSTKKRPRNDEAEVDPAANLDSLLPGAQAMKKRRLEQDTGATRTRSRTPDPVSRAPAKSQKARDDDFRHAARLHAERLDAERRNTSRAASQTGEEREDHRTLVEIGNLTIVEDMEIPVRVRLQTSQTRSQSHTQTERWDPRWNGLKNFKRFKRKGDAAGIDDAGNSARRVLVQLQEEPRKDFGIGAAYWLESPASTSNQNNSGTSATRSGRRHGPSASTQNQSQSQSQQPRARTREELEEEAEMDVEPEEIAGQPREGSRMAEALRAREEQTQTTRTTQPATSRKRPPAAATAKSQPPAKRTRQAPTSTRARREEVEEEDEEDEDGLNFRFGRKR